MIAATASQLHVLVQHLPESDYYVDLDAALDAQRRESLFNVVDLVTGWKVDLIIQKSRPFSQEEFQRRRSLDLHGTRLFVASAEDVVIAKLEWAKLSQSERQIEAVVGILEMRKEKLDRAYIERWVNNLGLADEWRRACESAGFAG